MDENPEKIAQDPQAGYGMEVLCASWIPLVAAIAEPVAACRELVADLAATDVDSFLASFYRSQQG